MDSHYGLGGAEERVCGKGGVQENRYHRSLPVVTVYDIGAEAYNRQYRQHSLAEEGKPLYIPFQVGRIGTVAFEVILVIHEIEGDTVVFILHDADMDPLAPHAVVHIEVMNVLEFIPVLIGYAGVIRHYDSDVELFLVDVLRKCAYNVGKTARFNKGNALGSGE